MSDHGWLDKEDARYTHKHWNIIQPWKRMKSIDCDNMVGPSGPYAKESKSDKEIQKLHGVTYMRNLKKGELVKTESWIVVTNGWGCRKWDDVGQSINYRT